VRDGEYEPDVFFHWVGFHRVRQDLVDPQPPPTGTDEPMRDAGEGNVSVQLDPNEFIARVTITSSEQASPSDE
jgi:hypothetical protein